MSSRRSVPSPAAMNLPILGRSAPVNAPRAWPNSSLSMRFPAMAPQGTARKEWLRRGEHWWIKRARKVLPVPVSPLMSTMMSCCAANAMGSRRGNRLGVGDERHRARALWVDSAPATLTSHPGPGTLSSEKNAGARVSGSWFILYSWVKFLDVDVNLRPFTVNTARSHRYQAGDGQFQMPLRLVRLKVEDALAPAGQQLDTGAPPSS